MDPLESEIAALEGLPAHDLRIAWRRLYRDKPPRCLSRDLMVRTIAYRMQERAHGGLAPAIRRRLHSLVGEIETKGTSAFDPAGNPNVPYCPSAHRRLTPAPLSGTSNHAAGRSGSRAASGSRAPMSAK